MTAPYFGCANDLNLQAMVDDPADLKRGRPLGPASGDRESTAVDTYRQGKIPPFGQTATPASAVTIMSGGSTGSQ
jgi:type IV pilus biogenesis protein CpaD/CtpE